MLTNHQCFTNPSLISSKKHIFRSHDSAILILYAYEMPVMVVYTELICKTALDRSDLSEAVLEKLIFYEVIVDSFRGLYLFLKMNQIIIGFRSYDT